MGIGVDESLGEPLVQCLKDAPPAPRKSSQWALTANLVNTTLGCGILSLPWAMAGASILPAAVLTVLVLALNAGTILILVHAAERHQVFDLGGLLRLLPGRSGRFAQACCNVTIWISVFLCLIGYLVVVADSLKHFLPQLQRHFAVGLGVAVVLPLCFLDQQRLAFSSSLSIAANLYVCTLLMVSFGSGEKTSFAELERRACFLGLGPGSVTMVSVLMQAAVVQMCVLPMYEQLQDRSPRRFAECLGAGFVFVSVLFIAFSCVAYLAYGSGVASNILLNLPPGPFGAAAQILMALAVLGVYPLLISSMVAPLQHWEEVTLLDDLGKSRRQSCLERLRRHQAEIAILFIISCSAVGATFTTDLGKVNLISGASQVAGLVSIGPGLTGLYLVGKEGKLWRASMYLLIAFGLAASGLGLTYTDNYAQELEANCLVTFAAAMPARFGVK